MLVFYNFAVQILQTKLEADTPERHLQDAALRMSKYDNCRTSHPSSIIR